MVFAQIQFSPKIPNSRYKIPLPDSPITYFCISPFLPSSVQNFEQRKRASLSHTSFHICLSVLARVLLIFYTDGLSDDLLFSTAFLPNLVLLCSSDCSLSFYLLSQNISKLIWENYASCKLRLSQY